MRHGVQQTTPVGVLLLPFVQTDPVAVPLAFAYLGTRQAKREQPCPSSDPIWLRAPSHFLLRNLHPPPPCFVIFTESLWPAVHLSSLWLFFTIGNLIR